MLKLGTDKTGKGCLFQCTCPPTGSGPSYKCTHRSNSNASSLPAGLPYTEYSNARSGHSSCRANHSGRPCPAKIGLFLRRNIGSLCLSIHISPSAMAMLSQQAWQVRKSGVLAIRTKSEWRYKSEDLAHTEAMRFQDSMRIGIMLPKCRCRARCTFFPHFIFSRRWRRVGKFSPPSSSTALTFRCALF